MPARRPQLAELGLFLLVVALPLTFTPFSTSPFGDPKLVILVGGSLALWGSGLPLDRRIGALAALWTAFTALSALTGVEPIRSLASRTDGEGGGLMLVLSCAAIVVTAVGVDAALRERTRRWFVVASCIVGALGLVFRFAPDVLTDTLGLKILSFVGATMGNQLFAAALLAAGIAAALVPGKRLRNQVLVVAFLALGAASFGERSSLILPAVAVIVTLARTRMPWRAAFALAATAAVVLLGWQIAEPMLPGRETGAGAALAPLQGEATDVDRAVMWRVTSGSIGEHPLVGWGPGTTQVAYLTSATPADIEEATRRWADAHNLFLETAVTSGILGLIPLVALLLLLVGRAWRAGPDRAWSLGAAAALGAYAMVEPLNLVLTPLLFLFAAMAAGLRAREPAADERTPRGVRLAVGIVLSLSLVVSLTMIAGATFERWGRHYGEEWAYRAALRVQPWRLTSTEQLALQLAAQGRAGDEQAGAEAKRLIAEGVERFPWDVNVRVWAADVDTLLNDPAGSRAWRRQHVERFPADATVLTDDAPDDGFTLPGDEPVTGG
ncbi:MAG: O-antigen ligase family protein [Actinomycetota bacterium]